jgi:hypothetical protein
MPKLPPPADLTQRYLSEILESSLRIEAMVCCLSRMQCVVAAEVLTTTLDAGASLTPSAVAVALSQSPVNPPPADQIPQPVPVADQLSRPPPKRSPKKGVI